MGKVRSNEQFEKCPWCNNGIDREMLNIGSVQQCWDCQGTGLKGGQKAKDILDKQENSEQELGDLI